MDNYTFGLLAGLAAAFGAGLLTHKLGLTTSSSGRNSRALVPVRVESEAELARARLAAKRKSGSC